MNYSHRIERKELAQKIRDNPDLDYEEPRELAEFLHSIDNIFDIEERGGYYHIWRSEEEREERTEQEIDEIANDLQDL